MKIHKLLFFFILTSGLLVSCSKDNDDEFPKKDLEVENFIYKGMNNIYLYKANVPELADDYFATQTDRDKYLGSFDSPEDLYYNGLVATQYDRFSFMTDNYVELEKLFSGITKTTGMNYGLSYYPDDESKVFGFVRYVQPDSPADQAGLERGMIFTKVDGVQITPDNYRGIFDADSFELTLASYADRTITETEKVSLTKVEYTANPVYISKVLDVDGLKVGYLMYNSFVGDFDDELNAAFADFKAQGIDELVLDLRYNGGGSVESAVDLSSMITGQFNGEVFVKQQWNDDYQAYFEENHPDWLIDRFNDKIRTGENINSLNLDKVYIIGTGSTASASELVINGLNPYIDVVQVGTQTVGKYQASVTLYDSPNFGRENANPNHTYAIQPLVYKSTNANGVSDYVDGLSPDIQAREYVDELGTLGDPNEPLLAAALQDITKDRKFAPMQGEILTKQLSETGVDEPTYQRMYIDKLPASLPKQ